MSYACKNRAPFDQSMRVQDGYRIHDDRRMVLVPFRMAKECQYQKNDQYADPQCVGCKWKQPKGAQ